MASGKALTHPALTHYLRSVRMWDSYVHTSSILRWLKDGITVTLEDGTKLKANKKCNMFFVISKDVENNNG